MRQALYLILFCSILTCIGCSDGSGRTNDSDNPAWRQYIQVHQTKDLNRAIALIDSMEQSDLIGTAYADFLRAIAYDQGWQMRIAEHYYRKAHEGYAEQLPEHCNEYVETGYRWATLRLRRGDTEGALLVASNLLDKVDSNVELPDEKRATMLLLMAQCQEELQQTELSLQTFEQAYETLVKALGDAHHTNLNVVIYAMNVYYASFRQGDFLRAQEWLDRADQTYTTYARQGDSSLVDEYRGHLGLAHARLLQATGHTAEAASAFASIPRRCICNPLGYSESAQYLMSAGRYDEAAAWYELLDSTYLATDGARMTFDNISTRLAPRYIAYRKAGRHAEAQVIADSIANAIDSALVWQKKSDAAELSVIYQTHQKDLELTHLQFTVTLHRLLAVALVVILLLIVYLLRRSYKYNKVLSKKNRYLYEQMQERVQAETAERQKLQEQPDAELTTEQQLYCRLCAFMDQEHPYTDEALNRDTLALQMGTNTKYIEQAIRTCSRGETVGDFITRYRLEHVARLLKTSDEPIATIGALSGISSRATLARLFRNAYGMTCSEFRQAAQQGNDE